MALSHDKQRAEQADKATELRKTKNTPWPDQHKCNGCGIPYKSDTNYNLCPDCVKQAYDVLT